MRVRKNSYAARDKATRTALMVVNPRPTLGYCLVQSGHCKSTSAARALLKTGRVWVNGAVEVSFSRRIAVDFVVRVMPADTDRATDVGEASDDDSSPHLIAWCKPCGVLCTARDELGRDDYRSASAPELSRPGIHPVGRLDCHSCGLLLFTTDGRLTRALLDPATAVPREYECVVRGRVCEDALRARLRAGVDAVRFGPGVRYEAELLEACALAPGESYEHANCDGDDRRDDGEGPFLPTATAKMDDCGVAEPLTRVRVVVREGRHRMVRRMLAHCGYPVLNLRRLAYGAVKLGGLRAGQARLATAEERRWARSLTAGAVAAGGRGAAGDAVPRDAVTLFGLHLSFACTAHDALLARIEVRPLARCNQHQVLHPVH